MELQAEHVAPLSSRRGEDLQIGEGSHGSHPRLSAPVSRNPTLAHACNISPIGVRVNHTARD